MSIGSPSTSIAIDNRSSCTLSIMQIYHDSNRTSLSLPNSINPHSLETGNISFSSSWSNTPQRVTGTYLLTCGQVQHVLSLMFYAGEGPSELGSPGGYWLQSTLDRPGSPVIITPSSKVSITDTTPLVITLYDTEIPHDIVKTNHSGDDELNGSSTGNDGSDNQSD